MSFNFEDLFIFEMANNHQGSTEHGLRIIEAMGKIREKYNIRAAVKLQYRDLDSFIHDDFKKRDDVKHIPRFMSTRLSGDDFDIMVARVKELGMLAISTPFDEISVNKCVAQNLDVIKVASCSADDWPLLEKVARAGKPVIISTGGVEISAIDDLVSFFSHKNVDFALMHCVALYPSPNDKMNMNFMDRLKKRYPEIPIGFSGHEAPDNNDIIKIAVSKKASIYERHVGVETDKIKLNNYSMNPAQVEKWVEAALLARTICGSDSKTITKDETDSLLSLKRGAYAKKRIAKGERITVNDVYFAMPCQDGQTTSGELGRYRSSIVASKAYGINEAVSDHDSGEDRISFIREILHDAKGMIFEAGIRVTEDNTVEISHHYGIANFRKNGALIVNVINREYCKKLIVVFPGQVHPFHYHQKKEETFQLLWGKLRVEMEGRVYDLKPGQTLLVERGADHSFTSENGAIFEEISTTHIKNDSFYKDEKIARLDPLERKTMIDSW
jgi:sialic acid synthase SpsE/quercetin dioxygenase-like cupin family protein